jgi:hypothetical protein
VLDVFLILQHDLVQQIGVELNRLNHFDRPGFGVGFWIVESELNFKAT